MICSSGMPRIGNSHGVAIHLLQGRVTVSRQPHKLETTGSIPVPATKDEAAMNAAASGGTMALP